MSKSIISGSSVKINAASIVELKAELYKKQQEFQKQKLSGTSAFESSAQNDVGKKPKWMTLSQRTKVKKKPAAVMPPRSNEPERNDEEENTIRKSKAALERKAALYEKLKSGHADFVDDETDTPYLVDFERKYYNEMDEKVAENEALRESTPPPAKPDEEWVEFVDSLGRSRKCMKKDLATFKETDENIEVKSDESRNLTMLSDDMRREMLRKKWEKEEEEAARRPMGPVHYENVKFDEVREMGIGHFKFATDESKRQEQFQQLNNLREQTLDQRTKRQHLKEKRKAALDARLAKVKLRKGISDAFDEEVSKDNDSDDSKKMQDEETAATISPAVRVELHDNRRSMEQQSELQNDIKTDTSKKVKKYDPSQERLAEFAPPAEYFENSPVNQRRHQQSFKKPSFAFNSYNHTWNWQPYPSVIGAPPPIPPTDTGFQYKCHDTDLNRSNLDPRTSKQRAYTVPVTSVETSNADNYSTTTINEKDIQNLISFYRNSTD